MLGFEYNFANRQNAVTSNMNVKLVEKQVTLKKLNKFKKLFNSIQYENYRCKNHFASQNSREKNHFEWILKPH